ncbi:hypothetical protein M5E84_00550 [[Ruminococcus] torques]|nr:hypothetical protein M5E84_00550 [[Ruminococcus] torques]
MIRFSEIPYSEASFKSALFGRLAPIEFTIECSAGNAAAPITLNPLFSTSVFNSKSASSYSRHPYVATRAAGVPFPEKRSRYLRKSAGTRP